MSHQSTTKRRLTLPDLHKLRDDRPVTALTAYSAPVARLLDDHIDLLLVGDSLGMVLYGMESTLPVTLEDMIRHGVAVVKASAHACVIVDMPFGSYQESPQQAFASAARIMKETGAQGVKLEGGTEMAPTVRFLSERAIPIIAHIGLKPQYIHSMGGYRYQGRDEAQRRDIREDAIRLEEAGASALLLEGMDAALAAEITAAAGIPTIGIGAGPACDGQILVTEDMLGLSQHSPKFVRQFATLHQEIAGAVQDYVASVTSGEFPGEEHSYGRLASAASREQP